MTYDHHTGEVTCRATITDHTTTALAALNPSQESPGGTATGATYTEALLPAVAGATAWCPHVFAVP